MEAGMATVRISFDGGNVPIVTGDLPADDQTPIAVPVETGFTTNHPFIVAEGLYCYGLRTAQPHRPLWRVVQAVDGQPNEASFRKSP
jgi:hypothetical protein